jgi:hypothetical protein
MISASTRGFTNRNPQSSYIDQLLNESSALGYGPQSTIRVKNSIFSINHKHRVKIFFTKNKYQQILAEAKANALAGTSIKSIANIGGTRRNPLGTPPGTSLGTPPGTQHGTPLGTRTGTRTGTPATPQSAPIPPGASDGEKALVLDFKQQMLERTESDWKKSQSDWVKLDHTGSNSSDEQKLLELQNEMVGFDLNENNPRAKLKRKSSDFSNSDQGTFKKPNIENQDMNQEIQDIMIEQGCENDENSNSSTLATFFKLPICPLLL